MIKPALIGAVGAVAVLMLAACAQHGSAPQGTAAAPDAAPALSNAQLVASFSTTPARFTQQGGETLYRSICQGCHMPGGQGANAGAGFFPDLRSNQKFAAGAYPVLVVMNGLNGMPPFGHQLNDQQIADVVNYVRTHFGNQYADAVTAQSVTAMRPVAK